MSVLATLVQWKNTLLGKLWRKFDPVFSQYPVDVFFPQGVFFDGEVESASLIRVEGEVRGSIRCPVVVFATTSKATVEVESRCLYIEGYCRGVFRSDMLYLAPSGHVEGDIHTETLYIEDGARMRGRICVGGHGKTHAAWEALTS
jgi:cytoskeletal protein CcmA (bactofilin family)